MIENNIHNNNDKKNNGAREEGRYLIPLDKCTQSYYFGHFIDSCLHKLVPLWDFAHRDDVDIMLDCKYYQGTDIPPVFCLIASTALMECSTLAIYGMIHTDES